MSLILKIKRLCDTKLPTYQYEGDAGLDLYVSEKTVIPPGARKEIKTGVALAIPSGYVGLIWDKSGISMKRGLKTLGGVVDCGYRGEIIVGMVNLGNETHTFEKGDKVAQMIIQQKEAVSIEEATELDDTDRGEKGFGSSGK